MEIRVRTAEEISADRLTIEVNGARLYTSAQGDSSWVVAAPLRRRIKELDQSVAARDRLLRTATEERERFRAGYETAEAEASEARRRVIELTAELAEQRQRADANQAWAERAEGRVAAYGLDLGATRRKLADAERAIQTLSAQLGRVSGAVHSSELVHGALRRDWTSWSEHEAAALTTAVRQVRDALGSPSLPEPTT